VLVGLKLKTVPEPGSILGFLGIGFLGLGSKLKHKVSLKSRI
jgi:hypothetical protein